GGLMFGPDLDTASKQYARWWIFRGLWFPYRTFFKHRSRWSHGLIFGTLVRVIYFAGIITLGGFLTAFVIEMFSGTRVAGAADFAAAWRHLGEAFNTRIGESVAIAALAGLWLGAASHTFADMAGTYIKTGKTRGSL
ncbi:MAG: metal-binding protein, partial [Pyrinomonadaceae bacterium]